MAGVLFTNFASTTILTAVVNPGDTTFSVAVATGALFPSPNAGEWFYCVLTDSLTAPTKREIIKVITRTSDNMTIVVRAQEGTTAQTWVAGNYCACRPTNQGLIDLITWTFYNFYVNLSAISAAFITFLQAGVGAVTRSVQSKLTDTVSVLDFMTTTQIANVQAHTPASDLTAFTAAIQAALNASTTVYFPPGVYFVNSALTIPANTHAVGGGIESSKIVQTTNGTQIWICSGAYSGISGFSVGYSFSDVAATACVATRSYTIATVGTTDFTLIGASENTVGIVFIATGAGTGTGTCTPAPYVGARALDISGFNFSATQIFISSCYDGFYCSGAATRIHNVDCYAYVNTAMFCIDASNDITLTQFVFAALSQTWGAFGGIRIADNCQAFQAVQGDIIYGRYSLTTAATTFSRGTVPQTCTFTDIYFDSPDLGSIIDNAYLLDFVNCGFAYSGFNITASPGLSIGPTNADTIRFTNCRFWFNGTHGVILNAPAKRTTFSNCDFSSNGLSDITGCGLIVAANTTDFTVENCVFANGAAGVTAVAATALDIDTYYTILTVGTTVDWSPAQKVPQPPGNTIGNTVGTKFYTKHSFPALTGTGTALKQPAGMQAYGIYITPGTSTSYVITGNLFYGNRTGTISDNGTGIRMIRDNPGVNDGGRLSNVQGATLTAANNLTLGNDGTYFEVLGVTQINLLNSTNWQGGSVITLRFASAPTVKHNQAASTTYYPILLAGAVDFVASANDTLTLRLDTSASAWYEQSRAVI